MLWSAYATRHGAIDLDSRFNMLITVIPNEFDGDAKKLGRTFHIGTAKNGSMLESFANLCIVHCFTGDKPWKYVGREDQWPFCHYILSEWKKYYNLLN